MSGARHVVISGGGSGVGAAIAHRFAEAGDRVTILGRTEATLQAQGLPYAICDVTDAGAVTAAFEGARAERGPVDCVIANAGAAASKPFARMDASDLAAMLSVNVTGVFNLWQVGLADMRAAGAGRLVAVASTAGLKGYPYVSAYCAAKHAVVGLTRALAQELARSGITVNAICPGFVETPLLERSVADIVAATGMEAERARASLRGSSPQDRFVQVEEVAAAAIYLCSETAASVNGHALALSGGET